MATATKRDALDEERDPQAALPDGEHDGAAEGSADEVDIDELLSNPEAFEKADAALRATAGQGSEEDAGPKEGGEVQPPTGAAAAAGSEDPDPIVETIEYRGNLVPVRKSEQKALMQKGRSLEYVLEQLSPLRIVAEDAELMGLMHRIRKLPKGKDALKVAMRAAFEQALPEVEGYSREEIAEGSRLMEALLPAFGVAPRLGSDAAADAEPGTARGDSAAGISETDRITIEVNLKAALDGEPSREEAIATLQFVNEAIVQADRMAALGELKGPDGEPIPAAIWQQIRTAINDPKHPENFRRFFQEMGKQRRAASAPPKVKLKAGSLPAGSNQDRLAGGVAGAGTKTKARDAFDLNDDEWERTLRSL